MHPLGKGADGRAASRTAEMAKAPPSAVGALMDGTGRSGSYLAGSEGGKMRVMMVQLTQPLCDQLAAIGLDHLILDP